MGTAKRYSAKREAILEVLRNTKTHPTAEWVYQQLKPRFPDLSLGTVYRNLAAFRQDGTLVSVGVVNGQERFDADVSPQTHFICGRCGKVYDVECLEIPVHLVEEAGATEGFQIDHYQLTFNGTCKSCLTSEA